MSLFRRHADSRARRAHSRTPSPALISRCAPAPAARQRRLPDATRTQLASLVIASRRATWALEVTLARLSRRAADTGELLERNLVLNGQSIPVLLISRHGLFVFIPTADRARHEDFRAAERAAHQVAEHLPGYATPVRSAVVLADLDYAPHQWFAADGSGGVQVGSMTIGQFVELHDDPGPLPGDLQAITALLRPAPE